MESPSSSVCVTSFSKNIPEKKISVVINEYEKSSHCIQVLEANNEKKEINKNKKQHGSTEKLPQNSFNNYCEKEEDAIDDKHEDDGSFITKAIVSPIMRFKNLVKKFKNSIYSLISVALSLGVTCYMIAACIVNFNRAIPLLVIWCLVVGYNTYVFIRNKFGNELARFFYPSYKMFCDNLYWIKWIFISCIVAGLGVWIGLETVQRPNQLISGAGYLVVLLAMFTISKYPDKVKWRPILWGLLIQFCMGLFVLRTQAGFDAFNWVGEFVETFINFVQAGVIFVYGEDYAEHSFAFEVAF